MVTGGTGGGGSPSNDRAGGGGGGGAVVTSTADFPTGTNLTTVQVAPTSNGGSWTGASVQGLMVEILFSTI